MSEIVRSDAAPRPPMGWNSRDCFSAGVCEAEVRANAALMAEKLKHLGWQYVVVDLTWYGDGLTAPGEQYKMPKPPQLIDRWGRLVPNTALHPSSKDGLGFKPLADHLHGLGLKLGIHIMRGVPWQAVKAKSPILGTQYTCDEIALDSDRCSWYKGMYSIDMTHPGGQAYYDSLAELYASWEADFIRADDMNSWTAEETSPYRVDEVEGLSRALRKSGRDFVLSLSPGAARLTQAAHLQRHAHMWRISPGFCDDWAALKAMLRRCARWARFTHPQSWPDADMLPMGRLAVRAESGQARESNFTEDEQYTMMTLWCLARSPLMFGGHLPETGEFAWSLISNPEAIAVNQASFGGSEFSRGRGEAIWTARPEEGEGLYIGLFNYGDKAERAIRVDLTGLGFDEEVSVRDLWARKNLGFARKRFEVEVNAHGARLLLLKPN